MGEPIKNIEISIDTFFKKFKDEPLEELAEKFIKKYTEKYNDVLMAKENYNKNIDEIRAELRVEYENRNKQRDIEIDKYKEKDKFINEKSNLIIEFIKSLLEYHNKVILEYQNWLHNPSCNNPEFNRGYFSCWVELMDIIENYLVNNKRYQPAKIEKLRTDIYEIFGVSFKF